ncbi:MAG: DNA internalization-related competence protein ComEC/Rec2 [Gammaproteobacteria bacterium]|nr:DNA internalization-related competence protein ComEC/Rec2 [Gammaproteobacteria bacterium]
MRLAAISFLLGVLVFQQLAEMPDGRWAWLLLASVPLSLGLSPLRWPFWLVNGFLVALLHAQSLMSSGLDPSLEGRDLIVTGVVASIPEPVERGQRFMLDVSTVQEPEIDLHQLPSRIRLGWYQDAPQLRAGERWRLKVRLKQPHGLMNPGGYDYEAWLFRNGIRATGYVRSSEDNVRVESEVSGYRIERVRQHLYDRMHSILGNSPGAGVIVALAIGVADGIDAHQWDVFLKTGTNHLVAISGLHVGMVALLLFWLVQRAWSRSERLCLRWPAVKAGAVAGLVAALIYSALAGFAIPTQRTVIMLAAVLVSTLSQRFQTTSHALALALLGVLLFDPLAVMDGGFWLSFAAVAAILFSMGGRPAAQGIWWRWGRIHVAIALLLMPVTLVLFQTASLISPIANFFAIPWLSFVVTPLTLLGATLMDVVPFLGKSLLIAAEQTLSWIWPLLEWFAARDLAQMYYAMPAPWLVIPAMIGALWLLAPRGVPGKWVGGIWLASAFLVPYPQPREGEVWFTLLDVGQGLAAVAQTRNHVLVFDTGPQFSEDFDTGKAVILPFLRSQGRDQVDTLVISHGDNDHIGGARALLAQLPVTRVLSSVPEKLPSNHVERCTRGQQWRWDGVEFQVLHPSSDALTSENDNSCVMRIIAGENAILITGDIEKPAERFLLESGQNLRADVLVVPHHGSATSSTAEFIDAVAPRYALFPAGYYNRFRFPKADVLARYRARDIIGFQSGRMGAVNIRVDSHSGIGGITQYRETGRRYWHHRIPE